MELDMSPNNSGDKHDCFMPLHDYQKVKPVIDAEKQAEFYSNIEGFISYKAEVKDSNDFWIALTVQTGLNNSTQLSISQWSDVSQQLQLLKDLSRITHNAINLIERHQLQKKNNG
jgi:hypothetical protein